MVQHADLTNYDLTQNIKQVEWRVSKVEVDLDKECRERKEMDNRLFEKIDKMNNMLMYQLFATVLTLITVIGEIIIKH